jgi:lipid A 4'-phosphatase
MSSGPSLPREHQRMTTRQQEWLALALLGALATAGFELWPQLDLIVSGWFFEQVRFDGSQWVWPKVLFHGMPLLGGALSAAALLTIATRALGHALGKRWVGARRTRQAIFFLGLVVVGVGVVAHDVLKNNWGRARPMDVQAFGGSKVYTAPLQPSDQCSRNCSFVSGHAAGGFALMALGMLGSRRRRWRWWAAGLLLGSLVGLARLVEGRHFLGDVVFAGLMIWLVCLLLREVVIRLKARRMRKTGSCEQRLKAQTG